jgi:hypothetical protein
MSASHQCLRCGKCFSSSFNLTKHQSSTKCGSNSAAPNPFASCHTFSQVRDALQRSPSKVRQFLNPNLFPDLLADARFEKLTGLSRSCFAEFSNLVSSPVRTRFLSHENRMLLYFKKLRQAASFEAIGADFNISAQRACEVFWEVARDQHFNDPYHPQMVSAAPVAQLLQQNVVEDEFVQGVFHRVLRGRLPVILIGDHTYFYVGKGSHHHHQKRTYYSPKSSNVLKKMVLTNASGKVVYASPLSGSVSPALGDGNLAAYQLQMEREQVIPPTLLRILCASSPAHQVIAIFDRGYSSRRSSASGCSFSNLVEQESGGSTLLLFPLSPGDPVLNEQFHFVENPIAADNRPVSGKLTAAEANTSRLATLFRFAVECTFAAIKQNKSINERHEPYQWMQPADFCSSSRLDVVVDNCIAVYNRSHPGFQLNKRLPQSWSDSSLFEFGKNFARRLFVPNEFDSTECVRYQCDVSRLPSSSTRKWLPVNALDPQSSGFPRVQFDNLQEVSVGPYHLQQSDNYILNIQAQHTLDNFEGESWAELEAMASQLPTALSCWKFRQEQPPEN